MKFATMPMIYYAAGTEGGEPAPEAVEAEEEAVVEPEPEEGVVDPEAEEEESEELDIEGKKYVVPKSLKPYVMMEKDYRHGTMTLAEEKRAVAAEKAALEQKAKADAEFASMTRQYTKEVAQLENLKSQIEHYEKRVDWARWRQENPEQALQGTLEYNDLIRQRNVITGELNGKISAMQARDAENQKQARDRFERELPLKIKDWSPAKRAELEEVAVSGYGLSKEDFAGISDARAMQILNDAVFGCKMRALQLKPRAPAEPAKPIPKVKTIARASAEPSERDSDAEWLRKRNAQIAARAKANLRAARN